MLTRPDRIARRQAQGFAKMLDRALPQIRQAQQHLIGCLANFTNHLQARGRQHVPDASRKSNTIDRRIVRQFRPGIDQVSFGHYLHQGNPAVVQRKAKLQSAAYTDLTANAPAQQTARLGHKGQINGSCVQRGKQRYDVLGTSAFDIGCRAIITGTS
jgi:hypothetical protein